MWNNSINSFTMSYVPLVLAMYAKSVELRRQTEEGIEQTGIPQFVVLLSIVSLYPIGIAGFLKKHNAKKLYKEKMIKKCGAVYEGLHLTRHPWVKYYYPMFLIKRISFVLIVMIMPDLGCHQIQLLV